MTGERPPARQIPERPRPDGYETHHFKIRAAEHTWSSRDCSPESFHRERSELRVLMAAVHCDLMRSAGDDLAAAYYRQPAITDDQVRRILAILVRHFGLLPGTSGR